jgi:hypothetical protein
VSPDKVPQAKNEGGSSTVASPTVPIKQPGKSKRGVGAHPSIFSLLPASSHACVGACSTTGMSLKQWSMELATNFICTKAISLPRHVRSPAWNTRYLNVYMPPPDPKSRASQRHGLNSTASASQMDRIQPSDAVAAQHARAVRQHIICRHVLRVPRHWRVQPLGRRRRYWASGAWLRLGVLSAASNSVRQRGMRRHSVRQSPPCAMMRAQLPMVVRPRKRLWKFLGAIDTEAAGAADFFGSKKMGPTGPLSSFYE